MLTSHGLSSTALHCTPHLPTVNVQTAVIEPSSPLKGQVEKVERGGAGRGAKRSGEGRKRWDRDRVTRQMAGYAQRCRV